MAASWMAPLLALSGLPPPTCAKSSVIEQVKTSLISLFVFLFERIGSGG